jgi:putative sterol carrier protein
MGRFETPRDFFEDAERRVDPARAAGMRATYRFDVEGAGTWRVEVADGRVAVAEQGGDAECVVRTDEATFLKIVNGETSPITAYMFGKVKVEGDVSLVTALREFLSA